jgi:uncharacterized protein (DUF169 family)
MPDYPAIEKKIQQVLGGTRRPIAIAFVDSPPAGVARFEGSEPSSCSFWRLAAAGRTFYTVPADHQNCPVGGYTHNLLEPERMPDLAQTLALMSGIGYIRMEEVGGVFHLDRSAKFVVYSPLADAPIEPSVAIASGKPARVMLLVEAAARAGEMSNLPLLGRPTCMAIPAAMAHGAVASSGCIGNRVYTGVGDDEFYVMLRGATLARVADEIATIESANQTLTAYHQERRSALSTI